MLILDAFLHVNVPLLQPGALLGTPTGIPEQRPPGQGILGQVPVPIPLQAQPSGMNSQPGGIVQPMEEEPGPMLNEPPAEEEKKKKKKKKKVNVFACITIRNHCIHV